MRVRTEVDFVERAWLARSDLGVVHPRQILPGATYLVTRRCTQRQFFLIPRPLTNKIFRYCLAYAVQRTGVEVHAVVVMSNHYHLIVTDPDGVLPLFVECLKSWSPSA